MSKHTPGSWKKVSDTCVTDSDGIMVAEVNYGRPKEEYAANAQLIAAAPDLLTALETLIEDCGYASGSSDYNYGEFDLQDAKAAIVKAKGES